MTKAIYWIVFLLVSFGALAQNITTIAGGGPRNLQALQTGLPNPSGLAVDSAGNVYVSVKDANQVWKISTSGFVSVFAGTGASAFSGDSGQAAAASLSGPEGLVFDTAGNLYVADSVSCKIRKIAPSGVITTVASCDSPGTNTIGSPTSLAIDSGNNLYVVENRHQVSIIAAVGGMVPVFGAVYRVAGAPGAYNQNDGIDATSAGLPNVQGIAVDSTGVLYIAEQTSGRVRKVSAGIITTVVGNGALGGYQFRSLGGLAIDRFNNLYIADQGRIAQISASAGTITTIAGSTTPGYADGPASAAAFNGVNALALDSTGSILYAADLGNFRIRKLASATVSTIAGNGTKDFNAEGSAATNANLIISYGGLALDNSANLLFTDLGNSAIRRVSLSTGVLTTAVGSGLPGYTPDGGPSNSSLNFPLGLAVDSNNAYYFAEDQRIRKFSSGVLSTIANVRNTAGYNTPGYDTDGSPALFALLNGPSALAVAANGDLYIADTGNQRVRLINASTGIISTVAGNGAMGFAGDNGLATSASVNNPVGVALDGAGNLFIAEGGRIRKVVLSSNIITTVAGNGTTNFADGVLATSTGLYATAVFADQSSNLFIADFNNSRIRKVTASTGLISTVAGNGTSDFSGDSGPATSVAVRPLGVAVDRSQKLYISDLSGRIRTLPVTACFFTVSAPTFYLTKSGGGGTVTISATNADCPYSVSSSSAFLTITSGASGTGSGTVSFSATAAAGVNRTATVSVGGQTFTVAQAGISNPTNIGFFQPSNPAWVLDANGDGYFDAGDKVFSFAGFSQPGAIAVVGDWNGDGRTKIGYYINGFWVLDYDGDGVFTSADKFYAFGGGGPGYVPVVGDWNGSGTTKIGYYRAGFWVLDTNGDGVFNAGDGSYALGGNAGEIPIVGDWNGDHRTKIGFYFNGGWVLDYNGNGTFDAADKYYGGFSYLAGDKPVVGDWSGSGTTKIGVFRNGFWVLDYNGNGVYESGIDKFYAFGGNAGDAPIVADWNGDGRAKVGVFNSGFWTLDFNGNGTYDAGDRFLAYYGGAGSQPIIGRW